VIHTIEQHEGNHEAEASLLLLRFSMVKLELIYLCMLALNISMFRTQKCINEQYGHVLRDRKDLCYSGLEDLDLRVVVGKDINATDIPWHTIITINEILTAAHLI
jgi:hypothetical protein